MRVEIEKECHSNQNVLPSIKYLHVRKQVCNQVWNTEVANGYVSEILV